MKEFKEKLNEIIINNIKNDSLMLLEFISAKVKNYLPSTNQVLRPEETGLERPIYIPEISDANKYRHSDYRIKTADQNEPNAHRGKPIIFARCVNDQLIDNIIDNSEEIDSLKLSSAGKRKLKDWIKLNRHFLIDYINNKEDFNELRKKLISIKKGK